MDYEVEIEKLTFKIPYDFNIITVKRVENILNKEESVEKLIFNLENTRITDSECIVFFYKLIKNGKNLSILRPPEIFFQVLNILDLQEEFKSFIID